MILYQLVATGINSLGSYGKINSKKFLKIVLPQKTIRKNSK